MDYFPCTETKHMGVPGCYWGVFAYRDSRHSFSEAHQETHQLPNRLGSWVVTCAWGAYLWLNLIMYIQFSVRMMSGSVLIVLLGCRCIDILGPFFGFPEESEQMQLTLTPLTGLTETVTC